MNAPISKAPTDRDPVALAIEELLRRRPEDQDAEGNGTAEIADNAVVQFAQ